MDIQAVSRLGVPVRYKCQFCEKSFSRQHELTKHVDKVHKGIDPKVICEICGKLFADKNCLRVHERYHKDEKRYACHLCDKRFHLRGELKKHLWGFHGKSKGEEFTPGEGLVLKAVCMFPSCGSRFGREAELQQHVEENHTPVEDNSMFMCTLCGRVFANQGRLATHNLIHSKERVHECHICGKTFVCKTNLKEHLQAIHNVGKAQEYFRCEQPNCEAKFKTRKYLTRHVRVTHRKIRKHIANLNNETVNPK
ncbi:unnamed protein product [Orchesella dallaii]|uniref:C2H2-type domain-containing protein n=1 Tax=Orchesella dallaii TaxID=48710 RepID=A0ABP1RHG0_9HEXA